MLSRRTLVVALGAAPLVGAAAPAPLTARLTALEARSGGRLGVAIVDTGTGKILGHRAAERFPMCSTFKLLGAALALARVDRGLETLDRAVAVPHDLIAHSPRTAPNAGGTMTIAALCEASMIVSDNTAANLLLAAHGGPAGVTAFVRALGDRITRLDRNEPSLNDVPPGDPRDTTSPAAMAGLLRKLVLGDALSPPSRARLTGWLVDNRTGDARLRAGLPAGWRVGDKTGTADDGGIANDVAVVWPPDRAPVIVTAYLAGSPLGSDARNAVIAEVGRIAAMFAERA